ncbi:MAG: hypothetical protein R2911_14350 [Caldilineaceae bacterium]
MQMLEAVGLADCARLSPGPAPAAASSGAWPLPARLAPRPLRSGAGR